MREFKEHPDLMKKHEFMNAAQILMTFGVEGGEKVYQGAEDKFTTRMLG